MTSTVLLRLAGPQQSWGTASRFRSRESGIRPSKSGVVGLVAAALGIPRDGDISELANLRFGVRTDQPGRVARDYHTASRDVNPRTGQKIKRQVTISERFYLEDAVFIAALEGANETIRTIESALRFPVYPIFLGRKAFPPAGQVSLGIRNAGLTAALAAEPWKAGPWWQRKHHTAELVTLPIHRDANDGTEGGDLVKDSPVSFSGDQRQHSARVVVRDTDAIVPNPAYATSAELPPTFDEHNPFALI